ncbi:hypothetical protein AB4259_21930 [Vibrio amylolyticus]|uniref:hypothetical protein n=1 Tax=Vibrio amylolyticus TaxID=2847292 RepID=UPI00354D40EC
MRDFEVIERAEHYFRCYIDGVKGKHCRIVIDENSDELPLGCHKLHVEEITDIYKHFGRDSVFRMTLPFSEQGSIEICTLNAGRHNQKTYRECVRLGGKWEPIISEWVFSSSVNDQVENLRQIVHSEPVTVEAEFKETISQPGRDLTLFGFELVKGLNVNFTPILSQGVTLKKGDISYIVGTTSKSIARAGTVVRLVVPKLMLESDKFREDYFAAISYRTIRSKAKRNPSR